VKFLPDVFGIGGFLALCAGVYLVGGAGWALIVLGGPLTALYLVRELRAPRRS
jgi:hypothetical protein